MHFETFSTVASTPGISYTGKNNENHTKTICWKCDIFLLVFSEKQETITFHINLMMVCQKFWL